ncbi:hypothetical protein [Streptacidiphilus fuscans]|uniref:Uncharacterized protein n=1 Tax=Streptacidiphilus fuscans TaxID=2789292 RepID=A0A931B275_9ACTN|nr:hypothetical protein [Streptacidiphilus fuscans]MBF9069835.1 hypothetical protein [Streptacidiphilus fuscans]
MATPEGVANGAVGAAAGPPTALLSVNRCATTACEAASADGTIGDGFAVAVVIGVVRVDGASAMDRCTGEACDAVRPAAATGDDAGTTGLALLGVAGPGAPAALVGRTAVDRCTDPPVSGVVRAGGAVMGAPSRERRRCTGAAVASDVGVARRLGSPSPTSRRCTAAGPGVAAGAGVGVGVGAAGTTAAGAEEEGTSAGPLTRRWTGRSCAGAGVAPTGRAGAAVER